jgi:hypothetical protein
MKFNELSHMMQKPEPKPDTYEAGMAQNQLLKIGTHAIKIHNMIDDGSEMEAWVAKKIDLASSYVKSVHGYTAGQKAGTYDDDGMTEDAEATDKEIKMAKGIAFDKRYKDNYTGASNTIEKVKKGLSQQPDVADALKRANEDAGEGHMSKSQLYATAKMAIELLDMINKGDDLEGWVQTKLNLAADYLQAVYHYEDYQKLNPYREELDGSLMQKHAGVIQKHLDEILSKETKTADVDTKPGMMRILKKKVNEVEKELAKENRKQTDEGPLDGIGKAFGNQARELGAKAAGAVGMKKTAAGLQGRVDVDKKSAELDTALAQYVGQQRADKNRIDPRILQGFLQKQGIDQKYMQYVKGPINQQQAGKLLDKISADSFAGKVNRKQPQPQQDIGKSVAQRATAMKGVVGQKGGSAQQMAKGLGKAAQGQRMDPAQAKQLAPYAAQIQKIMADPQLSQVFRQLIIRANKKQTVTADVNESLEKDLIDMYKGDGEPGLADAMGMSEREFAKAYTAAGGDIYKMIKNYVNVNKTVTADVNEIELDEGRVKEWLKQLAAVGVFVTGLAAVGSIENAINNQLPAVQAMNTAYDMAVDQGNDDLAKMIKNDLSAVKVRLHSGKDLQFVKAMQDKYEKFVQNEGLAYESKLQINLNQRLK